MKPTNRRYYCIKCERHHYAGTKVYRQHASRYGSPARNWNPLPDNLYQTFHGNPPRNIREVEFHELKPGDRLVKLGRLLEVVYLPEGATQHKGIAYSHKFPDWGDGRKGGERPVLAVSQDGRQLFVINDRAKPKVGRRGIVG